MPHAFESYEPETDNLPEFDWYVGEDGNIHFFDEEDLLIVETEDSWLFGL